MVAAERAPLAAPAAPTAPAPAAPSSAPSPAAPAPSPVDPLGRFDHGGNVHDHPGAIDFSANLNPLGMPPQVQQALADAIPTFDAYPDVECRDLTAALSRHHGVPGEWILCTAGATDLIERAVAAVKPRSALVTAPCFSGYEEPLERAGARILRYPLQEQDGFKVGLGFAQAIGGNHGAKQGSGTSDPSAAQNGLLGVTENTPSTQNGAKSGEIAQNQRLGVVAVTPSSQNDAAGAPDPASAAHTAPVAPALAPAAPDLVFLCTPNNPTGVTVDPQVIRAVCQAARDAGAMVVLDECFLDFTPVPSSVPLCAEFPNLVVMRAFTKLYAMAGLRLGYGICSDPDLMARMRAAGQTWAVSTPAQVAGVAALGVEGYAERTRKEVAALRRDLAAGLARLGLTVVPGEANYLLVRSSVSLYEPLLERGLLIRRCENYEGLDAGWFRVAVRTRSENERLLAACEEVCS